MMPTKEEIIEMSKQCCSKSDIAKRLNLSVSGICQHINKLGITESELKFVTRTKTSNISEESLRNALETCDWHQINTAKFLNSSPSTITRLIGFYRIERVVRNEIKLNIDFKIFDKNVINNLGLNDIYLRDLISRIESKIEVVDSKTWIYKYSTTNGYPKFTTCINGVMSSHKIHRLIYFLTKTILTTDECLCHIDDNRLNVHPDNLFVGTRQDNNLDKAKNFRTNSELTENDIYHIVELYDIFGWTQTEIGDKFNLSQVQIGRILRGDNFKHVERKLFKSTSPIRKTFGEDITTSKLTNEQVVEMRRLWNKESISKNKLSKIYQIDKKTVSDIVEYKTWKHI